MCSNFRTIKFTKTICWPGLQNILLKIGGDHFKRYITCANYEFSFSKNALIFQNFCKFLQIVIWKLLCIRYWENRCMCTEVKSNFTAKWRWEMKLILLLDGIIIYTHILYVEDGFQKFGHNSRNTLLDTNPTPYLYV